MSNFLRLKHNSQGMIFDPSTGVSYLISPAGQQILKDWLNGKDDDTVAQSLAGQYDVPIALALRDIKDFRAQLRTFGLN